MAQPKNLAVLQQGKLPAFIVLALAAGTINYLLLRPGISLFSFFSIGNEPIIIDDHLLRIFFTGYFSDIAWCVALCAVVQLFNKKGILEPVGKLLLLSLPFATEIAQHYQLIPGTFDWLDMAVYGCIEIIFIIRFLKPLL